MTAQCGIYLITHVETGLKYVGQSRDIKNRIKYHRYGYGKQKLAIYIRKFGFDAFTWSVVEICPIEMLNERESYWIEELNCISPSGFNLTAGGQQAQKISEETRERMSIASTGRKMTEYTKQRLKECNTGRKLSEEHRANISKGHIGQKPTQRTIELRRIANTGRFHSEESKQKMRKPKDKPMSAEHIAKIVAMNTGRKHSEETKAKMSATKAKNKLLRQMAAA